MRKTSDFYPAILDYFAQHYLQLSFILVFAVAGFILANFIKRKIKNRFVHKAPNAVTATFISQITSFILKSIVVFTTLYLLGLESFTNKILAGAGLLTFVVGFAMKDIGENFLAGIILAFKSPFSVDDLISVNGIEGFVKDINIRETLVKTPDGKDVFIPNAVILQNPLFNYTLDGFLRYEFVVGIGYENNPTEAIRLIFDTIQQEKEVLKGDKGPAITIEELATSTINLKIQFWVDTFKTTKRSVHHSIRSQVMNDVVSALLTHGISLPASILEIKNLDPKQPFQLKMDTP